MPNSYLPNLDGIPDHLPKHVRIAQAIALDISRGRLRAAEKLPGSRQLAQRLGVHRNTVNAALRELISQGWLEARPARGYFVRLEESQAATPRTLDPVEHNPGAAGYTLPPLPQSPLREKRGIPLSGGSPDPRHFPTIALARAYRRVLSRHGTELLDYGKPYGEPRLRAHLAEMLRNQRGLTATSEHVLVTRGSQQAIWLAAHVLLKPGDRVAVEDLGYPPAWDALRNTGASLVPLPVDEEGLRVDALQAAMNEQRIRAIYLTPQHQFPTTVALSPGRRLALMALAADARLAVIEDDYAHEFHYAGRPRLPLASDDPTNQVIYVGSLSKVLAPGLRIGYAVGSPEVIEQMGHLRAMCDYQGDNIGEAAVAELIEDGELQRHMRRMRRVYETRRDHLVELLHSTLPDDLSASTPDGGLSLWVRVHHVRPALWSARCRALGVDLRAGEELSITGQEVPYVRMSFSRLDCDELDHAVQLVRQALPK